MIIAVDFDGTLQINKKPNLQLMAKLKSAQRRGGIVILWTCREGKSLREAVEFLYNNGFSPNYINCNCPQALKKMGHDSRKIYADVYIDDKG
jgi:hydroxymethylpyrimidine pyrophosphatase-like HAD family hydrolase